jgi:hypothetical protein
MINWAMTESLIQNKALTTLNLNDNKLKQGSGAYIMMVLIHNKVLKNLYLKVNLFDSEDCFNILEGMKSNTSIKELYYLDCHSYKDFYD